MLTKLLPILGDRNYIVRPEGSGLRVVWNLNKHTATNRLTYIHGRDYGEVFQSNNLLIPGNNEFPSGAEYPQTQVAFIKISKNTTSQNPRSRFFVDLSRPPRFINRNEKIEALLVDPIAGRRALANGSDHFISVVGKVAPELVRHNKAELSKFIEQIRGTMVAENTLFSLDGIEGSLAAAAIMACANQEQTKNRIILGPSRYRLLVSGRQIPRPMVRESLVISIFAKATGAAETDAGRHFDEWSSLPVNPTVIKSGRVRGRHLTQGDINRFVTWQPDVDEPEDIPPPIMGEMQFQVSGGRLVATQSNLPNGSQTESLLTGIRHLINLIEDVQASSQLGNWAPGSLRKLERLSTGLRKIDSSELISERDATLVALDGEAFRHVYGHTQEELSEAAKAELLPLFLQMDVVFSQLQAWKDFKSFGASVGWGQGFSEPYREALKDVAEGISQFPPDLASEEVRSALGDAATKIDSAEKTDQVLATARVRNVLSSIFSYVRSFGLKTAGKVGERIQDVATDGTVSSLHQATLVLKVRLIELASTNPNIFGWVLRFFPDK